MKARSKPKDHDAALLYQLPDITKSMDYDLVAGVLAARAMSNNVVISEAEEAKGVIIDKTFDELIKSAKAGNIADVNRHFKFLLANNPLILMLDDLKRVQTGRYHSEPVNLVKCAPASYHIKALQLASTCVSVWKKELAEKTIANYKSAFDFTSPAVLKSLIDRTDNHFLASRLRQERPLFLSRMGSIFKKPAHAENKVETAVVVPAPRA